MFVLKKNPGIITALSFFPWLDCAVKVFLYLCFVVVTAVWIAVGPPVYLGILLACSLFIFVPVGRFVTLLGGRKRFNSLLMKPKMIVESVTDAYYLVLYGIGAYLFVATACKSLALKLLVCVIGFSLAVGLVLAVCLSRLAIDNSIIWYSLYWGNGSPVLDPGFTINTKTGIKINSSVPEFDRTVKPGADYFAIDSNDNLVIVGFGKQKEEAVIIPKESVTDITFTTITGIEKKVCYSNGVWCRFYS